MRFLSFRAKEEEFFFSDWSQNLEMKLLKIFLKNNYLYIIGYKYYILREK